MIELNGPVFTIFTAFDDTGEVDLSAIESYIEFLTNHGARHFYLMPFNGRFAQLSNDEIRRLNAFCIRCVKSDPQSTIVVSDPICGSTQTKLEFALEAKRHGADYLSSLMSEKYFSAEQVADHYSILSNAEIHLIAHAMPFLSGYTGRSMDWPREAFERLASVQGVRAIKEDSKDASFARGLIELYGERFDFLVAGRKRFLVDVLAGNRHAYINGISMFNPNIAKVFWSLLGTSVAMALEYVEEVDDPFWDGPVAKFGWHRVNKAALESCGLMSRRERQPMPELDPSAMLEIEEATRQVLDGHSQWTKGNEGTLKSLTSEC